MSAQTDEHKRWEPLPGLPEHPFGSIEITYRDGTLTAVAHYAIDPPVKGVRFDFGRCEAFKVYEEYSDPWMENTPAQPMIKNDKIQQWVWPLQEVRKSNWVARVIARHSALDDVSWKHFVVVTMDVTLHVMVNFDPEAELLA